MTSCFIHIPKVGGNTINHLFKDHIKRYTHNTSNPSYKFPHKGLNEKYDYIFTFIRNPHDRLVSAYFHLLRKKLNKWDSASYKKYLDRYNSFNEFVLDGLEGALGETHFCPQYKFIENVDCEIFIYEYFDKAVLYLYDKFGMIPKVIPQKNATDHKPYKEYYTPESWEKVEEIYAKDIQLWIENL